MTTVTVKNTDEAYSQFSLAVKSEALVAASLTLLTKYMASSLDKLELLTSRLTITSNV